MERSSGAAMAGPAYDIARSARGGSVAQARIGLASAASLYLLGMLVYFRGEWLRHPRQSFGDNADGGILVATLEHWFRVFSGEPADWRTPEWLWPTHDTLANTDTYFVFSLPYSLARMSGLHLYQSYDVALASLATAGFWGFYSLARSLGSGRVIGGAFSFVFAFGSLWLMKLGHGQTYTIMVAPAVGLLVVAAFRRTGLPATTFAAAAGGLLGVIFLSAPQTGWFLCFDLLVWAVIYLVLSLRAAEPWRITRQQVLGRAPAAIAGLVTFALCLVGVMNVYATTTAKGWAWIYVQPNLPALTDLLNVQPGNVIWHHLLYQARIVDHDQTRNAEHALGYTPVILGCALFFVVALLRGPWRRPANRFALTCLLVPLVIAVLQLDLANNVLWHLIYHYVPGGNGIRVPFRIQITAAPFLYLGLALAFTRSLQRASDSHQPNAGWHRGMLAVAAGLCLVEQANTALPARNTETTLATLNRVAPRPPGCDVFYITAQPGLAPDVTVERQATAMVLSQTLRMPTVNGDSSWLPPNWDLFFLDEPGYAANLRKWVAAHPSHARFCGLSLSTGDWTAGLPSGD